MSAPTGPARGCGTIRAPSLPGADRPRHSNRIQPPHDLSSQTRRQAHPQGAVGESGPTELLHQPRLRPRRPGGRPHPALRRRPVLVQHAPRLGGERRRPVDHQGRVQGPLPRRAVPHQRGDQPHRQPAPGRPPDRRPGADRAAVPRPADPAAGRQRPRADHRHEAPGEARGRAGDHGDPEPTSTPAS